MSSSFTWAHVAELHRQFAVSQNIDTDDVDEDERMVEDLLVPSSPLSTNCLTSQLLLPSTAPTQPCCATPESIFASTDPFYIAQSEAARSCSTRSHSPFSKFGLPSQQSPFVVQEPFPRRRDIHSAPPPLSGYPFMFCDNISRFQPLRKVADSS
jgi:hypothetical protein